MTTRPGNMTARQIAAENRKARTAAAQADLAARLEVEGKVSGGPFDPAVDTDADAPPDATPPLPPVDHDPGGGARRRRGRGAAPTLPLGPAGDPLAASAPATVDSGRFAPAAEPKIVDGLIVPAQSVADSTTATWVLVPVGEVASIGLTGRAVGITPHHGRWLAVWIGDKHADRDAVFERFATDLADARRSRR